MARLSPLWSRPCFAQEGHRVHQLLLACLFTWTCSRIRNPFARSPVTAGCSILGRDWNSSGMVSPSVNVVSSAAVNHVPPRRESSIEQGSRFPPVLDEIPHALHSLQSLDKHL